MLTQSLIAQDTYSAKTSPPRLRHSRIDSPMLANITTMCFSPLLFSRFCNHSMFHANPSAQNDSNTPTPMPQNENPSITQASQTSSTTWHLLAHDNEIPEGMCLQVGLVGRSLLACKVNGQIYCIEDRCSHREIPLNRGWLEGFHVVCPLHGATFDIRNGQPCRLPATRPIASFPIQTDDQQRVFVALPDPPTPHNQT